jgi:hypothetical protein
MMTRPSSQLWVVSTAGTPDQSPYLLDKVERGRSAVEAGLDRGVCYFEWSAPDDAPPADPETWRSCMPALGLTVAEDAVRSAQRTMARSEFSRAYLNRWVLTMGDPIIPVDLWQSLAEPHAQRPEWVVLGVDIAPQSRSAAIVACGERDGHLYVSVLEAGVGADWVVGRLAELQKSYAAAAVIVDERACASILPQIGGNVRSVGVAEVAQASSFFLDRALARDLRHRGERELLLAVDGAGQRPLGDSGWAWSRRATSVDITSLVAATLAVSYWHGAWTT